MSILVYTAMYGGRDRPQSQPTIPGVDFLFVTDDRDLVVPAPWRVHYAEAEHEHPNLAAKRWRTRPPFDGIDESVTPHAPYDYALWQDSNMAIRRPDFPQWALGSLSDGIATWRHPRRDDIMDEAVASLGAEAQGGRYDAWPLIEQAQSYLDEGLPRHYGLYATGSMIWTPETAKLIGDEWFSECEKWSPQDQISFVPVCWRHGVKPGVFPDSQAASRYNARKGWWANTWLYIFDHVEGTG